MRNLRDIEFKYFIIPSLALFNLIVFISESIYVGFTDDSGSVIAFFSFILLSSLFGLFINEIIEPPLRTNSRQQAARSGISYFRFFIGRIFSQVPALLTIFVFLMNILTLF